MAGEPLVEIGRGDRSHEAAVVRHHRLVSGEAVGDDVESLVGPHDERLVQRQHRVPDRSQRIVRDHAGDGCRLAFHYRNGEFEAHTCVDTYPPADRIDRDDLVWDLMLSPGEVWACQLDVPLTNAPHQPTPPRRDRSTRSTAGVPDPVTAWWAQTPRMECDSDAVLRIGQVSAYDLMALRIPAPSGDEVVLLPAAGLPWFLGLFGRDTLITTYQTISFGHTMSSNEVIFLGPCVPPRLKTDID